MSAGGSSFPAAPVLSCGPRPVELHGVCVGRGASQRLALAVKLARRDLQRTLLARGVAQFTVQSPPEVHISEVSDKEITERQLSKRVEAQCQLVAETAAKSAESDTVTQPSGGREGEGQQGSGGDRTEIQESSDLVQLKVALSKQVQRLQELCAHQHEREGGEEEEEEEREAAEGVSLMARKLYDLQRQVCASQGGSRGGREATERLAAARRAATRTLHSFSCTSRTPLPSQLLELLPQLCRDSQSRQLLSLAQMYSEILRNARERTDTSTGHVQKVESKPQSKDQRKKSRKQPKQSCSTTRKKLKRKRREAGRCEGRREPHKKPTPPQSPITPPPHSPAHHVPSLPSHSTSEPSPSILPPLLLSHTDSPNPHPKLTTTSSVPPPEPTPEPSCSHTKSPSSHPHFTQSSHPISPEPYLPLQPPQTAPLPLSRAALPLPHLVSMTTTLHTIEVNHISFDVECKEVQEMIFDKWQSTPATPSPPSMPREVVALKPVPWLGVRPGAGQCRAAVGWHEWRKIERLADLLLEEVVSDVCSELREASDLLAEQLYCGEFYEASLQS